MDAFWHQRVQFLVRSMAKNADASKAAAKEEKAA
jgi:hypothetical protein